MHPLRTILLLATAGGLAACQQAPVKPPAPETPPIATAPAQPAPAPDTAHVVVPPAPSGPVTAAMQQQAQRTAMSALGMLEAGREEEAKAELQRALASDPNNKLALNLVRQIQADPQAALGSESFSYTVRPNETLSMIAGRFLGDIYSFYLLARYNGIAVPRQVAGGQTLRIPGKAPSAAAMREMARESAREPREPREARETPRETARAEPVAPAPVVAAPPEPSVATRAMRAGEAAEKRGDLDGALGEYQKAASLNEDGATLKADHVRKQLVQRHALTARTALAKQDLDGAIRAWDRVLSLDPANDTAKLERQRAMTLKEKAKKL